MNGTIKEVVTELLWTRAVKPMPNAKLIKAVLKKYQVKELQ
jgi:hypothetical protein